MSVKRTQVLIAILAVCLVGLVVFLAVETVRLSRMSALAEVVQREQQSRAEELNKQLESIAAAMAQLREQTKQLDKALGDLERQQAVKDNE